MSDPEGPHPNPKQPDTEDAPYTESMAMADAVAELLIEKEIIGADELRRMIEVIDSKSPAEGIRMVARAWVDPEFKARMLDDVNGAAADMGIDAGTIPIRAVENTETVHNVIVCTLCSCYPRNLIGLPPDWYKDPAYRSRVAIEPRRVLREFGLELAESTEVRVWDSSAEIRYLVLPERPAETERYSEAELTALVTRDAMIGVAIIEPPHK